MVYCCILPSKYLSTFLARKSSFGTALVTAVAQHSEMMRCRMFMGRKFAGWNRHRIGWLFGGTNLGAVVCRSWFMPSPMRGQVGRAVKYLPGEIG